MTRLRVVLLAFLLVGCADITAPREWIELERDARFFRAWSEVEECSGLKRNPLEVRWYMMPGSSPKSAIGDARGAYLHMPPSIVIAEVFLHDDDVLRHEILHAILRRPGEHPPEFFVVRCGAIVT